MFTFGKQTSALASVQGDETLNIFPFIFDLLK
jgi:hypothetical protein